MPDAPRRRRRSKPAPAPGPGAAVLAGRRHPVARALVLAGFGVAVVLALAFRFGTERMWWVEIARYVPYPAYLAPALLLVAVAWRLGWGWRLLSLAAPLLVATEIMGLAWGGADEGATRVRFMTYNVKSYLAGRHEDGFARIALEIAAQDPDVVVMQDAGTIAGRPQQSEPVRAALAGRHTYVQGQYIVASRLPLKDCAPGAMAIPDRPDDEYVRCTITVQGREVDVFTAHFISPREGLNAARGKAEGGLDEWERNFADRLLQADLLLKGIVHASRPKIVAGDLNAEERSPIVRRLLATGLRDAFGSAGHGYGYTYGHALKPDFSFLRIDHVLVSPEIGVRAARVGGREGSEHRPVIADLVLPDS